jgi:hypothetical protein
VELFGNGIVKEGKMESANSTTSTTETIVVFIFSELLALPFCFNATDSLMSGYLRKALFGFFIGIPIAIVGFTFSRWKKYLPKGVAGWIGREGWKWWVPLAATISFVYLLGPDIYQRAISPIKSASITPSVAPQPVIPPPPMSDDEKQFRFDLRAFVLSDLQGQVDALGQLSGFSNFAQQDYSSKNYSSELAAGELFDAAERGDYWVQWQILVDDVNKPVDLIDLEKTSKDLHVYFLAYGKITEDFKDFLILSGINPHKFPPNDSGLGDPLAALVTADDKAIDSYGNLVTSPVAKSVGITIGGWFWASHTFQSFLTTSEPSDK